MHAALHASGFGHRPGASPAGSRLTDGHVARRKRGPNLVRDRKVERRKAGVLARTPPRVTARLSTTLRLSALRSPRFLGSEFLEFWARPRRHKNQGRRSLRANIIHAF